MTTSSTTNAIDLSLLPAPAVIETLSFDTILNELKSDFLTYFPNYDVNHESDPAVKILEIVAYREVLIRQRVNDAAKAVMLAYAQSTDLDHLGALMDVERLAGEIDSDYKKRIVLAPESYSVAGPEGAYVFHALSASTDCADATAISPAPGEVLLSVLSKTGTGLASPELIAAVNAAVNADDIRPITDNVTVASATIIDYSVAAEIYTYDGPDAGVVLATALSNLNDYIASVRKIGHDIALSGIIAALHVNGVQRVMLSQPAETLSISNTQAGHCTAIDVTIAGTGE